MKRGYLYTVIFMFILSSVLTLVLAGVNAFYTPSIKRNEDIAEKKSILYVLNILPEGGTESIEEVFNKRITEQEASGMKYYVKYDENKNVEGYALPFHGAGLWGSIKGYIGLSSDLMTLTGVDFTEQNETPGLGGRIDEQWFKEQFRDLTVNIGTEIQYGEYNGKKIDAITGATSTSTAVVKILNAEIDSKRTKLEVMK